MASYETCLCPVCSTPHSVDNLNEDIECLCGAKFYILTNDDGKKDLILKEDKWEY